MRNPSKNTIKKLKRMCKPGSETIELYNTDDALAVKLCRVSGRIYKMTKRRLFLRIETEWDRALVVTQIKYKSKNKN